MGRAFCDEMLDQPSLPAVYHKARHGFLSCQLSTPTRAHIWGEWRDEQMKHVCKEVDREETEERGRRNVCELCVCVLLFVGLRAPSFTDAHFKRACESNMASPHRGEGLRAAAQKRSTVHCQVRAPKGSSLKRLPSVLAPQSLRGIGRPKRSGRCRRTYRPE